MMSLFRQSLRLLRDNRVSSIMVASNGFVYSRCYNLSPLPSFSCTLTLIKSISTEYKSDKPLERMYPTGRGVVFHLKKISDAIKREEIETSTILEDNTFKDIIQDLITNFCVIKSITNHPF